ncbi:MAG: phenylalanine--tRNA ligase subunit beta [Armatimonadota bacterium]|nr:phenylalanine--tRNA ligase subunit beta [Armatimonadota bacterium]MDR7452288.1 phenylalanine--tRNA ligase subunit beta [Armatimonadota bacterium]MDR7467948.1 phenylalanine--tRNA ligase subunit beta [Armatimonadota bacterium]MDR7494790.1 phenylalanine--tRNA ligase subunit beta [Armatimonadota bacterium]MDR7499255.1 phenylalanine--tRNA ligase subunit beta [Armatimonadota bacterium]
MKVLLSWLREYVEIPYGIEELSDRLPMLGLGIEGVERLGDDAVFDLEIAANRGDLMSLLGVARELAAAAGTRVRPPAVRVVESGPPLGELTGVEVTDPVRCPRFTARMLVEARVGPSPSWLARRLEACGIRSINNIVDVTNYVMLETGQPMHAFDYDRLAGGRLVVRPARPGERLVTLDGVDRVLDEGVFVVADAERAQGVAGIIGGAAAEIGPQTRRVLLEAASWQAAMIRRTSRRLGVRTESSARFERGTDMDGILAVQDRAVALMQDLAGGRVLPGVIDVYPDPRPAPRVHLRWKSIPRLLGLAIPQDECCRILRSLGFELAPSPEADGVQVTVPSFRRDVEREEDLIEDLARHHGYDRIPETLPVEIMAQGTRAPSLVAEETVRDILVRAGLVEALTVSLTTPAVLEALRLPADHPWRRMVPLRNPLVDDHTHLRSTLLPGLLHVAQVNVSRGVGEVQIFEIGHVFLQEEGGIAERRRLGILMMGTTCDGRWNLPPEAVTITYYHLKGILEGLLAELGISDSAFRAAAEAWLHPGRAAQVTVGGAVVATLGALHPEVAARFDLPAAVYVADVDLPLLLSRSAPARRFTPLPRFPPVRRDVAIVLPAEVPAAQVEEVIRASGGAWLERMELFDVYTGAPVPDGHRSLAYALTFRAAERTLAADEVDGALLNIRGALEQRLRAKIRE